MELDNKVQKAVKPIIKIYSNIELELIKKIASHFIINEEFINSDYWYFQKLEELGMLNKETIELLQKYTNTTKHQIEKAMKDIGINSIPTEQLNIAEGKGLLQTSKLLESQSIQNIIEHSYNNTYKEFMQINRTIQESVRKTYTDIVTEVYLKTSSGVSSYQEAIMDSLNSLGDKGISIVTITDKNGNIRNYDVVGTVRRDILTATRGLAGKVNEQVIKESGNHTIRVSNHFGARITDKKDFTNHAWWQEIQFFCWDYDGKATEEEKKLPDFTKHCNYGDVQGILGINCKHYFTTWYGPLEKDINYTYDENEEEYEKAQKQRYLEEKVREWKRKQVVAKASGNEELYNKANSKVNEWQNKLIEFTKENDLKRDYTREYIKDYKSVTNKQKRDIILREKKTEDNRYSITQDQINSICNNELANVKFPVEPTYNSRIKDNGRIKYTQYQWGEFKELKTIEIGKQEKNTKEFLIDTLLHEKLEYKIASTNTEKYKKLNKATDENRHKYINKVIKEFSKRKDWDYGNR